MNIMSAPPAPRVAVIVLTHDDYAQRYLPECYASLRAQRYPAGLFRVFIVNNGGGETARRAIWRTAPDAQLIENEENLGWTGGNNRAVADALAGPFEYVIVLNVDTVLDPRWLETLVDAADARPSQHILQSTIVLERTGAIQSIGNRIHYLGFGYCNGYGASLDTAGPVAMDYASGAAMLIKRGVFEAIGVFRQDYFIYYDDMEFCWRARLAGFNVGLVRESLCYHKYEFRERLAKLYYYERNRFLTLLTLERWATMLLTLPCLLLAETVMSVYWCAKGRGMVRWQLLRYFARPATWRIIRQRRREIAALRQRRDADIVGRFAGGIRFAEVDHPVLRYVINPLLTVYWMLARSLIVW